MKAFRAVFRRHRDGETLLELSLGAQTIQAAIDEAKASGVGERLGAESLDILADNEKVEIIGLGVDPFKT